MKSILANFSRTSANAARHYVPNTDSTRLRIIKKNAAELLCSLPSRCVHPEEYGFVAVAGGTVYRVASRLRGKTRTLLGLVVVEPVPQT